MGTNDIEEFEEDNSPVHDGALPPVVKRIFPASNHEFTEIKALETFRAQLSLQALVNLSTYRPLFSTSCAQYGREVKVYGQVQVPSEDKDTGLVKFITVKKIIGKKLIKRVARNDRDKYFILHFTDGTEEDINECKFMKMTVEAHKENATIIRKRFLDIPQFYEDNCAFG